MTEQSQTIQVEKELQESTASSKKDAQGQTSGNIAVVLVRGLVGVSESIKTTLALLRLRRKNTCVVVKDSPSVRGMLQKVKDYATWGSLDDATFKELIAKRGEEFGTRLEDSKKKYTFKCLEVNGKKYKPCFRLNPPRKGFGRKGIKMPFKLGGALGNRAEKINDLITRML